MVTPHVSLERMPKKGTVKKGAPYGSRQCEFPSAQEHEVPWLHAIGGSQEPFFRFWALAYACLAPRSK